MKASYSSLRCPNCGATDFKLIKEDIFLCEYCKKKFSFNLDGIDFSSENTIFIEEIKAEFNKKILNLYEEKNKNYKLLIFYKNLANPNKLKNISIVCFILSLLFLFSMVAFLLSIICVIISVSILTYAMMRVKKRYKEYQPYVSYYASKVVDCENEIATYTKFLSKLTK